MQNSEMHANFDSMSYRETEKEGQTPFLLIETFELAATATDAI